MMKVHNHNYLSIMKLFRIDLSVFDGSFDKLPEYYDGFKSMYVQNGTNSTLFQFHLLVNLLTCSGHLIQRIKIIILP